MRQTIHALLLAGSKLAPGNFCASSTRSAPGTGLVPAVLILFISSIAAAQNRPEFPKTEPELLAILRSDAPEGQKALACKFLSVFGSNECIGEVAKLLPNERLSSWARITLEAIPGEAADEALRKASESLQGRQLVGVLNSLGVRRDVEAVELLSKRLQDKDAAVASAAAVALGRIGTAAAATPLRQALVSAPAGVRSAIAEGCILSAEQYLAAGNGAEAAKVYDEVRAAEVPKQRMLEATRGAILARGKDGIPLLLEQLRSGDKDLFNIGLATAREFPGRDVDQALAAELEKAAFPERAALIVVAMADRPQTVDLAAVMKAAGTGAKSLRVAALGALARVGNASCLNTLLSSATESDAEVAAAAKDALSALPGDGVNQDIVARLDRADAKTYPVLIEVVGQRRIDAVPALLKALESSDRAVRSAALTALGHTVPDKYLSVLITQATAPKDPELAGIAQTALKTAAIRMPDREASAAEIATALNRAPATAKTVLLETLAAMGGTKALAAVGAAGKSSDQALQDASTRLLGEWMTVDAAPVLLDLAKTSGRYQGRALRGYLRITRQFVVPDDERAAMCKNALAAARTADERKLVLEVAQRYPNIEMLKLAVQAAQSSDVKEDAKAAAKAISAKMRKTDEVRQLLSKAGVEN